MKVAVCVPTHNEEALQIQIVIAKIRAVVGPEAAICVWNDANGRGKGYALRMALRAAKVYNPDYYIFIDGDGDIDPKHIKDILGELIMEGVDIAVGKKQLPVRWDRKVLTFLSRIWIWMLFGLTVDSQTGIKGFNYAPEWLCPGWAFDIEILWKAKRMRKTMREVPVFATVSSGKSWRDIFSTLADTITIRTTP